jgi:hypothetical protein
MQPDPLHQCDSIITTGADPFRHGPGCACEHDAPDALTDRLRGAGTIHVPTGIGALPATAQAALKVIAAEAMDGGRSTYPMPADGRTEWFTVAALASQLTAALTGAPYAYPALAQDTADFARDQIAAAAAAALWLLIRDAVDRDNEHHLEAFGEALAEHFPTAAAEAVRPTVADLLWAALPAIAAALEAEAESTP